MQIKRALISVSDKQGIIDFAKCLSEMGVEIISTGGTYKALVDAGIKAIQVSDVTGFPEMMDGRVKTLHPKIHGGILAQRKNKGHMAQLAKNKIKPIDMVVVNLYPFAQTISKSGATLEDAIENIDIGGPSMVRAAAKNYEDVAIVVNPARYASILSELKENKGELSAATKYDLAVEAFMHTSEYDTMIFAYLDVKRRGKGSDKVDKNKSGNIEKSGAGNIGESIKGNIEKTIAGNLQKGGAGKMEVVEIKGCESALGTDNELFPETFTLTYKKAMPLRYGENPHQKAAFYHELKLPAGAHISGAKQHHGKELSFNNILDAECALETVREFDEPAVVIVKHNNPCGVAIHKNITEAYKIANAADPISAFGGIICLNRKMDAATAEEIVKVFAEVAVAPRYEPAAIEILKKKKNLRILEVGEFVQSSQTEFDIKKVGGGLLVQTKDAHQIDQSKLEVVSKRKPTEDELANLIFAWKVGKHVKSNSIILAKDNRTVGIGAGQTSRVDSVWIAAKKAGAKAEGCALASDAFFPFRDGIDEAGKAKISAVIHPGGAIRDAEVIAAADEYNMAMVLSRVRCFRH